MAGNRTMYWAQVMEGFRFHNQTRNPAKGTLRYYGLSLRELGKLLLTRHPGRTLETLPLGEITTDDLRSFIAFLQDGTTLRLIQDILNEGAEDHAFEYKQLRWTEE